MHLLEKRGLDALIWILQGQIIGYCKVKLIVVWILQDQITHSDDGERPSYISWKIKTRILVIVVLREQRTRDRDKGC